MFWEYPKICANASTAFFISFLLITAVIFAAKSVLTEVENWQFSTRTGFQKKCTQTLNVHKVWELGYKCKVHGYIVLFLFRFIYLIVFILSQPSTFTLSRDQIFTDHLAMILYIHHISLWKVLRVSINKNTPYEGLFPLSD